jgi:glucokinase
MGVDIGGTKIATGLVDEDASVLTSRTTPTRASEGFALSIEQVWSAIDQSITRDVCAIGICAPGPLNPKTGIIMNPPNLPGWRDVSLVEMAAARYKLPVTLENDCNAAGLAEVRRGAARGLSNVFYAAIGTGIGAAIIIDGKIYRGKNGMAGEAGHMSIDYLSSTICGCGTPGCIEALASGTAIDRHAIDLDQLAERLSAWLGGIVSLLDPEKIVIGGGVAQTNGPLFEKLRAQVPMRTVNPFAKSIPIVPAHFGAQAGIVGAALIARELIHANSAA